MKMIIVMLLTAAMIMRDIGDGQRKSLELAAIQTVMFVNREPR